MREDVPRRRRAMIARMEELLRQEDLSPELRAEAERVRAGLQSMLNRSTANGNLSESEALRQDEATMAFPTPSLDRLWDAEAELANIERIERDFAREKRDRPDYVGLKKLAAVWFAIMAIAEIVWPVGWLPWLLLVAIGAAFWEERQDTARQWHREQKKREEIDEIKRRVELLGFAVHHQPSRLIVKAQTEQKRST